MPTNVINVRDLEEEDIKLLESLAERFRAKRRMTAGRHRSPPVPRLRSASTLPTRIGWPEPRSRSSTSPQYLRAS